MLYDVRLALRRLRLVPAFTIFAVLSLALGIGVSTAIYSAVRTLLWMPLGIASPDELVIIHPPRGYPSMSWLDFQDYRAAQRTERAVAASLLIRTALRSGTVSQTVFGGAVSGEYFSVMGLRPLLGRLLDGRDETSASRVAVLSESFWRVRLHGDPAVVGQTIVLGGVAFEVVGVTAGTFHGLELVLPHSIWIPVTSMPPDPRAFGVPADTMTERRAVRFDAWARLRPNATMAQAGAEASILSRRLDAVYPPRDHSTRSTPRAWEADAHGLDRRRGTEGIRTIVTAILVAVGVVLLIACTNLANL